MMRTKAMIQKELGDIKGAIDTAKKTLVLAEKAGNKQYVTMLTDYIKEWETKK
jgi:DNA-binding ferritin-like protein